MDTVGERTGLSTSINAEEQGVPLVTAAYSGLLRRKNTTTLHHARIE
jgi:hypothetical protein